MKTLLFAPMYLDEGERLKRNIKWLEYYLPMQNKQLNFDHVYFVDNASSDKNVDSLSNYPIEIFHRVKHLPRWQTHAYGYWYVAFAKAIEYAIKNGYDKIVHIDTDVYLLNQKICNYVNNLDKGWIAFWCSMYNYPETTFQVICKDQFELSHRWFTEDFLEFYPNDIAETRIPFTHVEKNFKGDRYGEKQLKQDSSMDWYGQCSPATIMRFNP